MHAKNLLVLSIALTFILVLTNGLTSPPLVKDSKLKEIEKMGKSMPSAPQESPEQEPSEAELGRGSKSKKKDSKPGKLTFAEEMQEYMNKFIKQNKARHEKMMAFLKKLKDEISKTEAMLKKIEEDEEDDESSESKDSDENKGKTTTKAPPTTKPAATTKPTAHSSTTTKASTHQTTTTKSPAHAGSTSKAPTTKASGTTVAPAHASGTTVAPAKPDGVTNAPDISKGTTPDPANTNTSIEIKDSPFAEPGLELMNEQRAKHHAPPLALIANLTISAQQWADHLSEIGKISHSCPNYTCGYGENVAMMGPQSDIAVGVKNGVQAWYDEVADYDYATAKPNKEGAKIGHFTANVWINTTHVAFGATRNPTSGQIFIVAQFHPPGNWEGEYQTNVLPP